MAKLGGKANTTVAKKPTKQATTKAKASEAKVIPEEPKEVKEVEKAKDKAPETSKKEVKMPEPKAWQRVDVSDPNKPKMINQITFMGEKMDYEPGFKAEYNWSNLDLADGLKRVVTAKFPKADKPDGTDELTFMGYNLTVNKYGNSAVCFLSDADGNSILEYVSLATVLDVLQDLLNPKDENGKGECNIPWGTIDQVIKKKRNLKSRIKHLGEDDLPLRSRRKSAEETEEVEEPVPAEVTK